ncbi:hypothetical protein BGC07_01775 [Piscirickettsia litoralis]|uniref:YgiT-type zinc finger domain-containing protein n=1 Tax=Piscirickettsia litoralis TaxID=1891921 RepID=A0ABX2ZZH5_9GAMM|nr:hypothetical protein BGC07_01775 [Piscirickettsia litoralis]
MPAFMRQVRHITHVYKGHRLKIKQPGEFCNVCDQFRLSPEDIAATAEEITKFHTSVVKVQFGKTRS